MKLRIFILFAALFLNTNGVPFGSSFFTAHPYDLGSTHFSIPVAHFNDGRFTQSSGPISAPSTTTAMSPAVMFSPVTRPRSGIHGCRTCAIQNFNLVNQYRASQGLSQIKWSETLANLAEAWSKRMYDTRVFEHSTYGYVENIAWAYNRYTWSTAAQGFFEQWKNSPFHDHNMRRTYHACMGVGIYGDGTVLFATQFFARNCPTN